MRCTSPISSSRRVRTGCRSTTSPYSLYSLDIASFTMGAGYDQKDAEGFIRILGLPARSRAIIHGAAKEKVSK